MRDEVVGRLMGKAPPPLVHRYACMVSKPVPSHAVSYSPPERLLPTQRSREVLVGMVQGYSTRGLWAQQTRTELVRVHGLVRIAPPLGPSTGTRFGGQDLAC